MAPESKNPARAAPAPSLAVTKRLAGVAILVALVAGLGAGACEMQLLARGPRWRPLAREAGPEALSELFREREVAPGVSLVRAPRGLRLETSMPRELWSEREQIDAWGSPLPVRGIGRPPEGVPAERLEDASASYDEILSLGGKIFLRPLDQPPPERATLSVYAEPFARGSDGAWRVLGRRFSGEGFPVWPGEALALPTEAGPETTLRFATCAERAYPGRSNCQVVFRVRVGGRQLFEHRQEVPEMGSYAWHEVDLPGGAIDDIVFEVDGDFAFTSFLSPCIGPKEVGSYERRPWAEEEKADARPDLIVFLADTFRADNLLAYGADRELAPHIERFAAANRVYLESRSTSTSTLPAHSSLFTGLYPPQNGIRDLRTRLAEEFETIAEILAARGYRCGAITDSVVVSEAYGLEQGFALFDEYIKDPTSTLERARDFLHADDGRPVFLFVQTYRAHSPYHVTKETRHEFGIDLDLRFDDEMKMLADLTPGSVKRPDLSRPEVQARVDNLERLYRAGVRDVDRAFGEFLADLDAFGLSRSGYTIFTSDHGEGFGEHERLFHTGPVFEELIRIPMILAGPGIEPGLEAMPVTLLDLAPTLAGLAGLRLRDAWVGRSILDPLDMRPIFAYECKEDPTKSTVAMIEGTWKWLHFESELESEGLQAFYDLEKDPLELVDLADDAPLNERWAVLRERAAAYLHANGEAKARIDASRQSLLRQLGYTGD